MKTSILTATALAAFASFAIGCKSANKSEEPAPAPAPVTQVDPVSEQSDAVASVPDNLGANSSGLGL